MPQLLLHFYLVVSSFPDTSAAVAFSAGITAFVSVFLSCIVAVFMPFIAAVAVVVVFLML